ncbi:hypothetical protein I3842_10G000700 [Carya illinoinensis]|uniref:Uncharacterized protein n=1 Tax=Carya illinoinensis TaxID=32201 RepID=A0A922DT13_CARIL|nr:hypothetical protein I3842_10G000700 [Carya illinoinensis]
MDAKIRIPFLSFPLPLLAVALNYASACAKSYLHNMSLNSSILDYASMHFCIVMNSIFVNLEIHYLLFKYYFTNYFLLLALSFSQPFPLVPPLTIQQTFTFILLL